YAAVSGLLLGLIVLRGEAHVIVALGALLIFWAIYDMVANKRIRALVLSIICFAMAFFVSSIKILPYVEHLGSEPVKLRPYVALLNQKNLLFETLFQINADHDTVPVLHGKFGEEWGVFGSYVGYVPIILACIGLFAAKRYRFGLGVLLVVSLLLAEGTLYEYALRFIPPFDALLRMPVRNMLLVVLCIAVLAARGTDQLLNYVKIHQIKYILYVCVIIFIAVDLGRATSSVVKQSMSQREQLTSSLAEAPIFAQYEVRNDPQKNANILLARGFLLPGVCADQNRTVTFIKDVTPDTPFASVPFSIAPNKIILSAFSDTSDIFVHTRFDNMWASNNAYILENSDGSLHVIPHGRNPGSITLEQISPTKRAQQATLLTILFCLTVGLMYEKVK
ncbi:MAG: hypothetical protein AAB649_06160, partial [Patescibacteria group bacterium]